MINYQFISYLVNGRQNSLSRLLADFDRMISILENFGFNNRDKTVHLADWSISSQNISVFHNSLTNFYNLFSFINLKMFCIKLPSWEGVRPLSWILKTHRHFAKSQPSFLYWAQRSLSPSKPWVVPSLLAPWSGTTPLSSLIFQCRFFKKKVYNKSQHMICKILLIRKGLESYKINILMYTISCLKIPLFLLGFPSLSSYHR